MTGDADAIDFGTDGWRATLDIFTAPRVRMVGQAVATYLREAADDAAASEGVPLAVGYDARETSRGFAEELARVLAGNGFDVLVPERDLPTPVVARTVHERGLAGGLMVTASHNPPEYNGVKFIPGDGAPALPDVTDALEASLAEPDPLPEDEWGSVTETDLVGPYSEHVLDAVDADRVTVVTPDRGVLDPNLFFAATYDALLEGEFWSSEQSTGGDVVRTVSTSSIVDRVADVHGQSVHETAVGFKWVAEAMGEHDALVGGEESGGFGLTAHVRNKDGVAVALLAAAITDAQSYDERIDGLLDSHGGIVQDRVDELLDAGRDLVGPLV